MNEWKKRTLTNKKMYYAIKSFLSQVTVVLLDEEKTPLTFYTIRTEDINLGDSYVAQITEKMPEAKAFFADIGNGRTVYLTSKQALEIGQRINVVIHKEPRLGKIAEAKRKGNVLPPKTPIGLLQKGDFLAGVIDAQNYQQLDWQEEYDEVAEDALNMYVQFSDGARLVFETTHAFHCIDVDSHSCPLPHQIINEQASVIIGKEIIKRNLSGNILIDFIGQKRKSDVGNLKNIMSRELCKSPVPYQIMGVSPMGNVELRRQRLRTSLADSARQPTTKAYKLFEEIVKQPVGISSVHVSLSLYACLTTLMQKTWELVEAKVGEKVVLVADTQVSDFKIEYKR